MNFGHATFANFPFHCISNFLFYFTKKVFYGVASLKVHKLSWNFDKLSYDGCNFKLFRCVIDR